MQTHATMRTAFERQNSSRCMNKFVLLNALRSLFHFVPRAKTDMLKLHVRVSVYTTYTQTIHTKHTYRLLPLLPTLTIRSRVTGWDGCKDQFFVATQLLNRPDCHHDCWSNDLCLARKKGYHSHPTWKFNQLNTIDESTVQRLQKLGLSQVLQG